MIRRLLKDKYGINADEEFRLGNYNACKKQDEVYILVPAGHMGEGEIEELDRIAEHLKTSGDRNIAHFLKTTEGKPFSEWEDARYAVLNNERLQLRKNEQIGRKLAKFHYRGRSVSFAVEKTSRIGQWKKLWETRLDQMERVWNEMLFQFDGENDFDRLFLESFPYYMGLAENAIQYIVDTEYDDEPYMTDSGTVCHVRLSSKSWGDQYYIKNPFDWVFDHATRDLAEWTREKYFHNIKTYEPDLRQFIKEYESVTPLSPFSWRLYYARILFPLHYFECVEAYYGTSSEQLRNMLKEKMEKYLQQSGDYERFVGNFFELSESPLQQWNIPIPEWLISK
ncbi:spore coat putative kinase YutH [Cytobacillus purgationiresistens]|uniref:Spore coat protein YutH n=1 Tax=Cytobacillus purgationiresistens TaxID=863449 RepID=A0ABU0ARK8_9BACI|nr:spore coat protein YutH [Cytobacillus purgationiresistens]MDQ0273063.1 spore coat protein YutH [Cytobacillus purgationiresistens]